MKEIWETIQNYEGRYEVSNHGRVRSVKRGVILKQKTDEAGYKRINLRDLNQLMKTPKVHRLVAIAFIPSVEGKNLIDHIDRNPSNNRVDNLRWVDPSENNLNRGKHLRGVSIHKKTGLYRARGKFKRKEVCLGYFKKITEAYEVFHQWYVETHGEEPFKKELIYV